MTVEKRTRRPYNTRRLRLYAMAVAKCKPIDDGSEFHGHILKDDIRAELKKLGPAATLGDIGSLEAREHELILEAAEKDDRVITGQYFLRGCRPKDWAPFCPWDDGKHHAPAKLATSPFIDTKLKYSNKNRAEIDTADDELIIFAKAWHRWEAKQIKAGRHPREINLGTFIEEGSSAFSKPFRPSREDDDEEAA